MEQVLERAPFNWYIEAKSPFARPTAAVLNITIGLSQPQASTELFKRTGFARTCGLLWH